MFDSTTSEALPDSNQLCQGLKVSRMWTVAFTNAPAYQRKTPSHFAIPDGEARAISGRIFSANN
jgi:hypothetical protein